MAIFLHEKPATPESHEPVDSRRRRDKEVSRAAILAAAEDLFAARGPEATTTSEIAKAAGVTKSLIHHYFGSKNELWHEVQRHHFSQYFTQQKAMLVGSAPTAELLADSLTAFFRFLQNDPKSVRFMSWVFCETEPCRVEEEKELFELGIEKIRQSQALGLIRPDIEPLFAIKTIIALALNWFQSCHLTLAMIDTEITPEALSDLFLDNAVKILLDGIRPH